MASQDDAARVRSLLQQAESRMQEDGPRAAIDLYRQAVEVGRVAGILPAEVLARLGLSRCAELCGDKAKAIRELEVVLRLAEVLDDDATRYTACSRLGTLYMFDGRWDEATEIATRCRELARAVGDPRGETAAVGLIGQVARRRGDLDGALDAALDGLGLAQAQGDVREELAFLSDMALICLRKQDLEEAARLAQRGLERARAGEKGEHVPVFLGQLAQVARARGDLEAARAHAEEGLAAARELEDAREVAVFLQDLAVVAEAEEEFDAALAYFEESLEILEALADREGLVLGYRRLAILLCLADEPERGLGALAHALSLAHPMDPRFFQETFSALFQVAATPLQRRQWTAFLEGMAHLDRALAMFEDAPRGDRLLLRSLREAVEVLCLVAESEGDPSCDSAQEARRRAEEVDAVLQCDLRGYVEAGYRGFEADQES